MIKPLTKFLAIDLEMNQPTGSIIQIGACVGDILTGVIEDTFNTHVNPDEPIHPFITQLTGITQEMVDSAPNIVGAYDDLISYIKGRNIFCNPITWGGGDIKVLREERVKKSRFPGEEFPFPFGRRWIDAKTLFVSWRLAQGLPIQGGLAKSMLKLGIKFDGRKHDATDDAVNTFRIYVELIKKFKA